MELSSFLAAVRRQARVVGLCSLAGLALGFVYVLLAPPQFTASALMMLDNRKVRVVQEAYDDAALATETAVSTMDTQVEVLKSDKMAFTVINTLKLSRDPEFARALSGDLEPFGWLQRNMRSLIATPAPQIADPKSEAEKKRGRFADLLRENVSIRRVGRTFAFEVSYTSPDPVKAAAIANCYADAYLQDQIEAKIQAARRATAWLEERLTQLKDKAVASDLAVQKFRSKHNLIASGGRLVSEQQLGEANTQLMSARAETTRATARYEKLKEIVENKQTRSLVSESIGNAVNDQLRTKYLAASKRWTEISEKLGQDHVQALLLRAEMKEYEKQMFDELNRLAESARSDLDIAREREKSLSDTVDRLVTANAADNQSLVTLRELEREAEASRILYQTFLNRHQEALQQQSFPMAGARVISAAVVPPFPSHPRKALVLPLWFMLGGMVGAVIGAFRELGDATFRTGEQIREELGLELLGIAPLLKSDPAAADGGKARIASARTPDKAVGSCSRSMRYTLDHPLSRFSEVFRAAKISADYALPNQQTKYIGVISVLPSEGKSLISKNFGSLLAHLGARTLLIDADLRHPGLTREVAPRASEGLIEAILDGGDIEDLLLVEPESGLRILPAVVRRPVFHTSEFLASRAMRAILQQAEGRYAYVLLDLPPIGPVVDARAVASQIDAFLFVVEWGRTGRRAVREALAASVEIRSKCLGVILNKVNSAMMTMYGGASQKDYAKYYHGE